MTKFIVSEIFAAIFPDGLAAIDHAESLYTDAFGMLTRAGGETPAPLFLLDIDELSAMERIIGAYGLEVEAVTLGSDQSAQLLLSKRPASPTAREAGDVLQAVQNAASDGLARAAVIGAGYRLAAYELASHDQRGMTLTHAHQQGDITDLEFNTLSAGFYRFDRISYRHQKFGGDLSPVIMRDVLVSGDASIVLPYDPHRDEVVLIEQIRPAALARHSHDAWELEAVAGLISEGETPAYTAMRELEEEAGLVAKAIHPIAPCYQSPGTVSQFMYLFFAAVDLAGYQPGVFGLEGEGEDIRTHVLKREDAVALLKTGEANNAPLQILLYALALDYKEISRALLAELGKDK